MAEDENEDLESGGEEEEGSAETPFDNPYFLPVILWGLAAWFGWDIVTDAPAYQEWPIFNQSGFVISSLLALYFTRSAIKEKRAEREGRSK